MGTSIRDLEVRSLDKDEPSLFFGCHQCGQNPLIFSNLRKDAGQYFQAFRSHYQIIDVNYRKEIFLQNLYIDFITGL